MVGIASLFPFWSEARFVGGSGDLGDKEWGILSWRETWSASASLAT